MNIVIRVDSSTKIGTGHVMRCITLAHRLKDKDSNVYFVCRNLKGNLNNMIQEKGFQIIQLPNYQMSKDADVFDWKRDVKETITCIKDLPKLDYLLVDHYGIDARWETQVKQYVGKVIVIDDLANRPHNCEILIDQNVSPNPQRYHQLVPKHCQLFLGTSYALLRDQFRQEKNKVNRNFNEIKRILIFFFFFDPTKETSRIVALLKNHKYASLHIDVVVGNSNPQKNRIEKVCLEISNMHFHCQVDNMAELICKADLSIGAGGTATWERCYLGLPAIVIATADNQLELSHAVSQRGAIYLLGKSYEVDGSTILQAFDSILKNPQVAREMSENALLLMGEDLLETVINEIRGEK